MKWFDNWFYKMFRTARDRECIDPCDTRVYPSTKTGALSHNNSLNSDYLNFNLFKAQGGFVIQYQPSYSEHKANMDYTPKLVLVHREDDLGTAIAHIVTMTSLQD